MTAEEYLKARVSRKYLPYAKVIVERGKQMVSYPLKPTDNVPDDDDNNTIFIRIEDDSVPYKGEG